MSLTFTEIIVKNDSFRSDMKFFHKKGIIMVKDYRSLRAAVEKDDISIIQLWFTDVLGQLKSVNISVDELEEAATEGMGFDGSSVSGFSRIQESDMIAMPDISTYVVLPWETGGRKVARMICDILNPDGTPYDGDPRYVLRRILDKAADMGYSFHVGPEMEYFYFKDRFSTETLDEGGYFDAAAAGEPYHVRNETIEALENVGIYVEANHHEVAPSQHEICLRHTKALNMADISQTYRYIVKEVAERNGIFATFMPKPINGVNGSGMHVHQSLFKDDENAFWNEEDEYHLSDTAKSYTAGLLKHSKEIVAITNQSVNSYKRLVPGYEAPVYISWATRNRSTMIRVPKYKPNKSKATRIEFRAPDPACNPYLAYAVMLAAGLEGIKNGYKLADPIEENIYNMSEAERKEKKIESLPRDLITAIEHLEKSEFVKECLGEHIFNKFIENKKIEWDNYRMHVSDYELDVYLSMF